MITDVLSLALGSLSLGLLTAWLLSARDEEPPSRLSPHVDPLRTLH